MVEDYINFLKVIKYLKPYIIKFKEDENIKPNVYSNDYIIESPN